MIFRKRVTLEDIQKGLAERGINVEIQNCEPVENTVEELEEDMLWQEEKLRQKIEEKNWTKVAIIGRRIERLALEIKKGEAHGNSNR